MSEYVITIGETKKGVKLLNSNKAEVDGKVYEYELSYLNGSNYLLKIGNKVYEIASEMLNDGTYSVLLEGRNYETVIRTALQEKASTILEQKASGHKLTEIKAPMPGMILKINKSPGDKISKGETVIILEAMKMENDIRTLLHGEIKDIFVKEGSAVEKGAKLFTIQ